MRNSSSKRNKRSFKQEEHIDAATIPPATVPNPTTNNPMITTDAPKMPTKLVVYRKHWRMGKNDRGKHTKNGM